ncbi:Zinc finger SWIM domain-containing protein, partial [Actinidia chinensis var. chinensis]
MEFIFGQLKCAEETSHQLAGRCTCSIKIVYGLPCQHDLAHYRYYSIPIPLQSIDTHWRRLSMHIHGGNEEGARPNRTSHVIEILDGMDPHMREHMIDKFFDMADPSQSTVRAPAYNTEHRGRPIGRDEQSRRHIPSFEDASTAGSRITQQTTTSRGRGRCGRRSVVRNPPIHDTYIEKLPVDLQRYISHTVDVQPDGHCGFRAIAALIGYSEEGWSQVRLELIEEIQQNKDLYDQLY